jgi:competence ComEA-like helix-hairpin-helix protein
MIVFLCLIASAVLCVFAMNRNAISTIDKGFVSQSKTMSQTTNSDSSGHNQKGRTFFNIKTKCNTPLIELNTADTLDLQALRGVGSTYAQRIYNYRKSLGGFNNREQLKEVYGMTFELYEMLLPHITIDSFKIVKINVNTATIKQLYKHPYIDFYLAKAIVKYRTKEGVINSFSDLQSIYLFDDSTLKKLEPYIEF